MSDQRDKAEGSGMVKSENSCKKITKKTFHAFLFVLLLLIVKQSSSFAVTVFGPVNGTLTFASEDLDPAPPSTVPAPGTYGTFTISGLSSEILPGPSGDFIFAGAKYEVFIDSMFIETKNSSIIGFAAQITGFTPETTDVYILDKKSGSPTIGKVVLATDLGYNVNIPATFDGAGLIEVVAANGKQPYGQPFVFYIARSGSVVETNYTTPSVGGATVGAHPNAFEKLNGESSAFLWGNVDPPVIIPELPAGFMGIFGLLMGGLVLCIRRRY